MSRSQIRALLFSFWLALVLISLHPVPPLERALDTALSPLRLLEELTAPLRWARRGEARAAEEELLSLRERDQRERDELERALRDYARPTAPALVEGRVLVDAEVAGRTRGDLDELLIRLPSGAPVEAGLPVVWGPHYVGRLTRVEPERPGAPEAGLRGRVRLLTSRDFFVGASVRLAEGGTVQMTVGGLDHPPSSVPVASGFGATGPGASTAPRSSRSARSRAPAHLAVHNPSDREVGGNLAVDPADGIVVVQELLPGGGRGGGKGDSGGLGGTERFGLLAEGYRLGRLVNQDGWIGIEPEVDFRSGLFQVTVLAPAGSAPAGPVRDVLTDGLWAPARPLSSGDPSAWRAGLKISAGTLAGVEPGAALVHGSRLLGRVARTGPVTADVALLSDPGFELVALARLPDPEGGAASASNAALKLHALGRLTSLGAHPDGGVWFRWDAIVPLPGGPGEVEAKLFTGSGEQGLPRGLFVGRARIPLGTAPARGYHLLHLEPEADGLGLGRLWVRSTGAEGAVP